MGVLDRFFCSDILEIVKLSDFQTMPTLRTITPLVRVKTKYQVTLPLSIRKKAALSVGDFLEATVEGKKITLIPKSVIDRGIAESLRNFKEGRFYGPFKSVERMIRSLDGVGKRRAAKSKRI